MGTLWKKCVKNVKGTTTIIFAHRNGFFAKRLSNLLTKLFIPAVCDVCSAFFADIFILLLTLFRKKTAVKNDGGDLRKYFTLEYKVFRNDKFCLNLTAYSIFAYDFAIDNRIKYFRIHCEWISLYDNKVRILAFLDTSHPIFNSCMFCCINRYCL